DDRRARARKRRLGRWPIRARGRPAPGVYRRPRPPGHGDGDPGGLLPCGATAPRVWRTGSHLPVLGIVTADPRSVLGAGTAPALTGRLSARKLRPNTFGGDGPGCEPARELREGLLHALACHPHQLAH